MKKIILLSLVWMLVSLNATAQNQQIIVGQNYVNPNEVTLVTERGVSTTLKFDLNELYLTEVETDYGTAFTLSSEKAPIMLEAGVPELLYLPTAIVIPDIGSAELSITHGKYTDIENVDIAPSKGNLSRSINPATVPYVKGEVYEQNAFFPGNLAEITETFIMRDVRGVSVFAYPVQYNPVTKVLRIYSEMTITVNYTDQTGENEFTSQKRHSTIDPTFNQMYNNMFINYSSLSRDYPTGEEGELLIICHPAFMEAMQPYIDWKNTIGRKTTIVPTSAITPLNVANIKTYIANYYNNPANNLAYILLVGDVAQIPVHSYNYSCPPYSCTCFVDVEYAKITGGDNYLEVLIGRMSAETVAHVQTQVQRTIWYERDITTTDTWLSAAIGIAANEGNGGHDGNEADHTHMNNIRNRMMTYGYNPVYQEYAWNAGVPNTTVAQISSRFNSGVGMANYCNHGSETAWTLSTSVSTYLTYGSSSVNGLQNAGKLPFIFSVACLNGKFTHSQPCFAEAWMRATQNNQPTGAVATFMATISISWQPPMTAQDEFVNLCLGITHNAGGNTYGTNGPKRTFAGAALNASQRMLQRHGNAALNDFNSWLVFGDPTLMIRTKAPQEMTVTHPDLIQLGETELAVNCNANGALAALTYTDESNGVIILGTAVVVDGLATIVFEPIAVLGELTLAITGFDKVTYLATIFAGGDLELPEPKNLAYTVEYANHVVLTWDAPEGKLPIKGYNIYRNDELITNPLIAEPTYTDIVPQNGNYKYEVTAVYGTSLESELSESISLVINGMCIPFSKNITVEEIESENVLVSWVAPEYDGLELAGYNIYRNAEKINDNIIPAAELIFLDETTEADEEYCYEIEVIYNDCEESFKTEVQCIKVLSINDMPATQYTIFPNPTSGNITIEGKELNRIEIYDIQGRKLAEYTNIKESLQVNVSHLDNGIYFVRLFSNSGETAVKRLVVIEN